MKKLLFSALILVLLSGFSCQKKTDEQKPAAVVMPQTQEVFYYLPVNKQSLEFSQALVPANSKIVGCEDYLTLRKGLPVPASEKADLLRLALNLQFALKLPSGNFYYNPLTEYAKDLRVVSVEEKDGVMLVSLSGQFSSPGACADPVIKGMIQETVKQYAQNYQIILNGSEANWRCLFDQSGMCQ